MKITFISDTHNKHNHLTSNAYNNILGSGDVLVHAGDCTSMGKSHEITNFLNWFWQPEFYDWAFNLPRGEKLAEKWAKIPGNTDILITHGPAHGMLDWTPSGQRVGCEDLFHRIMEVQPKIHVCGHIHCAYGQKNFNGVEFLNASVLNERYEYENKPIKLEFDVNDKQIVEYYETN